MSKRDELDLDKLVPMDWRKADYPMKVEVACELILGRDLAQTIIKSQGVHWAIVAAMTSATTDQDQGAIETLRQWQRDENERDSNYEPPRA